MTGKRVEMGVRRPAPIIIEVDSSAITAYPGESLAAALLANGLRTFRYAAGDQPRGPFCNMGICFECLLTVDGVPNVRACMTPVRPGMCVKRPSLAREVNEPTDVHD